MRQSDGLFRFEPKREMNHAQTNPSIALPRVPRFDLPLPKVFADTVVQFVSRRCGYAPRRTGAEPVMP